MSHFYQRATSLNIRTGKGVGRRVVGVMVKTLDISVSEKMEEFYIRVGKIEDLEHRVIIKLDYVLGARVGELIQIRKQDCKFDGESMTIFRPILKVKGRPVEPTEIPAADSFVKEIREFVDCVKDTRHYLFPYRRCMFGYLYLEDPTRHISKRQVERIIKEELSTWPHYLRHMRFSHVAPHMRSTFEMRTFTHHRTEAALNTYIHLMPGIYRGRLPVG